jgi:hypothetical protein
MPTRLSTFRWLRTPSNEPPNSAHLVAARRGPPNWTHFQLRWALSRATGQSHPGSWSVCRSERKRGPSKGADHRLARRSFSGPNGPAFLSPGRQAWGLGIPAAARQGSTRPLPPLFFMDPPVLSLFAPTGSPPPPSLCPPPCTCRRSSTPPHSPPSTPPSQPPSPPPSAPPP